MLLAACASDDGATPPGGTPTGGDVPGPNPTPVAVDGSKRISDLDAGEVQAVCDHNDAILEAEDLSGVWRFMCAGPILFLDSCTEGEIEQCIELQELTTPWIFSCGLQFPDFDRAGCDVTVDEMFECWQTKKASMKSLAPALTCGANPDYEEPAACTFVEARCPTLADMLLL